MTPDTTRLLGAQRLLQQIVSAADPQAWLGAAAAGKWRELGLSEQDAHALVEADPRRLLVYRKLVRGTLRDTFSVQLPRTAARLGAERVSELVAAFCEQRLPDSQVLRDVAFEMCVWALPRLWSAEPPPFLGDLARFELFEFDVYAAERAPLGWPLASAEELVAERAVAFDGSMRLTQLDWRTDALPDDAGDRSTPQQQAVRLLAYRDEEGLYRQLELTPLAAAILLRLWHGEALGAAIQQACARHEQALDQPLIEAISNVLADLGERGVLKGSCNRAPRTAPSPWAAWLCRLDEPSELPWELDDKTRWGDNATYAG